MPLGIYIRASTERQGAHEKQDTDEAIKNLELQKNADKAGCVVAAVVAVGAVMYAFVKKSAKQNTVKTICLG